MSVASASDSSDEDEEIVELPEIQPAFVSTKKNIEEFKHEILQGDNGMLKVGSTHLNHIRRLKEVFETDHCFPRMIR